MRTTQHPDGVRGIPFSSPDSVSICAASRGLLCSKQYIGDKAGFIARAVYLWWNWPNNTIPDSTEKHEAVANALYDIYLKLSELKPRHPELWLEMSGLFLHLPFSEASKRFFDHHLDIDLSIGS